MAVREVETYFCQLLLLRRLQKSYQRGNPKRVRLQTRWVHRMYYRSLARVIWCICFLILLLWAHFSFRRLKRSLTNHVRQIQSPTCVSRRKSANPIIVKHPICNNPFRATHILWLSAKNLGIVFLSRRTSISIWLNIDLINISIVCSCRKLQWLE